MPVTDALYREIALADPEGKWELVGGRLRSKPTMSSPHNSLSYRLSFLVASQLDWNEYEVRQDQSRVQHLAGSYFIPDVFVFPVSALKPGWETSRELEVFEGALPFVAEVWSPSTGE